MARLLRATSAQDAGWTVLALHLSRLPPPAPRPYHCRIARALMEDAAGRAQGQVFGLANGDLVLLLRPASAGDSLAASMARLFQIDAPDPALLLTQWCLPADRVPAQAYVAARLEQTPLPPVPLPEPVSVLNTIGPVARFIAQTSPDRLLRRQTAVLFGPATGNRLHPLYQELTFSQAAIADQLPQFRHAAADPFLVRHVASLLDQRLLSVIGDDLRRGGALASLVAAGPRMHINLTLGAILSDAFPPFAAACTEAGPVGIEVALLDACADPEAFLLARTRLRLAGLPLVLDGVSHHAALLTLPGALQPDLVKLEWSRLLPEAGQALADAVAAIGPGRIVLHHAETEAALRWGLAHGIRRFQGRHVDAVLAAGRIGACPESDACTMRHCTGRAAAIGAEGRSGCANTTLLDAAVPLPTTMPA